MARGIKSLDLDIASPLPAADQSLPCCTASLFAQGISAAGDDVLHCIHHRRLEAHGSQDESVCSFLFLVLFQLT
jgi:hypothetical protein